MAAANKTGSNMTNTAGKPLCAERTERAIKATSEAVSNPNLVVNYEFEWKLGPGSFIPKQNTNRVHLPSPVHYMHRCGEEAAEMVGILSCVLIEEYLWKRPECFRRISRAVIAFCFPSLLNDHVRRRPIKVNKLIKPG